MSTKQPEAKKDMLQVKPGETIALCRCWKSKAFPRCDGTHRKLGLDKGPVVVTSKNNE